VLDVVKKVIALVIVILIIATADFMLFQAPSYGSYVIPRTMDPEFRQSIIEEHHLNDPIIVQYVDFIIHMFTGDYYTSVAYHKGAPIQDFIWIYAANSLFLFGSISLLSILAASALAAVWRRRTSRISGKGIMGFSILASSMLPAGILMIIYMIVVRVAPSLPVSGNRSEWNNLDAGLTLDGIVDLAQHAMIPVLSGVLMTFGLFALVLMFGLQKSPNAGERRLGGFWRALDSEMPFTRYLVAWSMTSVIIVDAIYGYNGLGYLLWSAASLRDFPLLMAAFFVISLMVAASIFILDIAVAALKSEPENKGEPLNATAINRDSTRAPKSFDRIFSESWSIYRKSLSGIVALLVLVVMAVAALAAPLISTVENPNHVANLEPSRPYEDWRNPLPPSLMRSPYTGFLHPLGTDSMGQDIYSSTIYGLRPVLMTAAIIFVVVLVCSFLIGMISVVTRGVTGFIEKGFREVFSIGSLGLLAMPPFVILVGVQLGLSLDHWGITLAFCVIYSLWSWSAIAKVARCKPASSGGGAAGAESERVDWFKIGGAILHVTKFGVLIGLITIMLLDFFGLGDPTVISWGTMLESAYERNAVFEGNWAWVLAPFVAILFLVSTTFVTLHQLEKAVERAGTMSEDVPKHSV